MMIALTGATGAMGGEVLFSLMHDTDVTVRCIVFEREKKLPSFVKKIFKRFKGRIESFRGDIARKEDCERLIAGAEYVVNCASLIPPKSDHDPEGTERSNFLGTKNLVDAIVEAGNTAAYIHIATVAMYGFRPYPHPWGRVGDPLFSSDYDCYSLQKLKAERYVLERGLKKFVSLRQTAVLHKYMFANNIKDGLMYHTVLNSPLEWVTDRDSGVCIKNLVERDRRGELDGFWNKIYNIGGGKNCRDTGYESLDAGFALMGSSLKKLFKPNWNATRNFHGVWFYDSDELENFLHFRSESIEDFWARMKKKYPYFKLAKIVPRPLLVKFVFKRLFKNTNAPMYWVKHGKEGYLKAFFGGREAYENIGEDWENFPLLAEGKTAQGEVDYLSLKDKDGAKKYLLSHGYDETKPLDALGFEDLQGAAAFRGGECLTEDYAPGELYRKLSWKCREGHTFTATPYTVLKGGYWCPCCEPKPWRYGALADIPFYGQVYFDSHTPAETADVFPLSDGEEDFLKN